MKKIFGAFAAVAMLFAVSCSKNDDSTQTTATPTVQTNTIEGRWDAPRSPEAPEDIAFVATFSGSELDLYVIAGGRHLKGTYSLLNDTVQFNITEAEKALTDVEFDNGGNMTSSSWMAGNLDAATLTLTDGYQWYAMTADELEQARTDFGMFAFKVSGTTATSSMVGIENLTFNKIN